MTKINTRADAQAGLKGSVVIAPQKRIQGQGAPAPGIVLSENRIGGVGRAINDDEAPNWGQVRSLFTCERFGGHVSGFPGWFEDCVAQEQAAAAASGIVHAMWGYTYEIPNFTDTIISDPGNAEGFEAYYWQYIIPVTTQVDRVTFYIPAGVDTSTLASNVSFALYDVNQSADSYPLFVKSEEVVGNTLISGRAHSLMLEERVLIPPGMYALAYIGPCFPLLCIRKNPFGYILVNQAKGGRTTRTHMYPYDVFALEDDLQFPDELNFDNTGILFDEFVLDIPFTYFDDTQEFA